MKCIMLIAILVLLQILGFSDSQTLYVCTSTKGQECQLDCETPDQSVSVTFTDPQPTTVGSCLASGNCNSGVQGYSVSRVNSTFTRLTIATLDYTRDYGNWSCSHGGTPAPLVLLPCPSPSTTINVTKEADNVTCSSKCQFPVSAYSSLSLEYTQNGKVVSLVSGALPVSKNVTTDGCDSHEMNVILQYQLKESEICGDVQFKCTFVNTYLGINNGSLQHSFSGCQSSTVMSSTVHTSTPEPSPSFQPCLISDSLLLWQCILSWTAICVVVVAVIILLGCCIFCLWKKRQKSEKKQSTENNKMQDFGDKKRNNKTFDDKTENKDRTDTKSINKSGYDNSGYDKSGYKS